MSTNRFGRLKGEVDGVSMASNNGRPDLRSGFRYLINGLKMTIPAVSVILELGNSRMLCDVVFLPWHQVCTVFLPGSKD